MSLNFARAAVGHLRRFGRLFAGFLLLPVGVVLLVLPGPGLPIILLALGLLAADFAWASKALTRVKQLATRVAKVLLRRNP